MHPHMVTLKIFDWFYLLDYDFFYICTKFHSNRPKNLEILEGGGGGAQ